MMIEVFTDASFLRPNHGGWAAHVQSERGIVANGGLLSKKAKCSYWAEAAAICRGLSLGWNNKIIRFGDEVAFYTDCLFVVERWWQDGNLCPYKGINTSFKTMVKRMEIELNGFYHVPGHQNLHRIADPEKRRQADIQTWCDKESRRQRKNRQKVEAA